MPPKAARGRAARGGRGGRGRGRGGSSSADTPTEDGGAPNQTSNTPAAERSVIPETSAQPSPNSSPVSVPTETPAPTPVRPTMPESSTTNGSNGLVSAALGQSSRGALGARGRGNSTVKSKFKPKVTRRPQDEREKLAADIEKKDQQERERAENRASRGAKSRGRGGRGRGDAMGRANMGRGGSTGIASGPFSMLPIEAKSGGGFGSYGGPSSNGYGGASSGTGTKIKSEGGVSKWSGGGAGGGAGRGGRTADGGNQFFEPNYPDEEPGPRINIEHINLISDDEDDEPIVTSSRKVKGKGKAVTKKGALRPVRVPRHEHKARVPVVNTDSSFALPGGIDDDNKDLVVIKEEAPKREWKGCFPDEEVKVKHEPGSFPSPQIKRAEKDVDLDSIPVAPLPETVSSKVKTKRSGSHSRKRRESKPVLQTEEDKAEYKRHLEDVAILAHELGGMQTQDTEGDTAMEEPVKKEGRLYLFQFPPILPSLYNPQTEPDVKITGSTEKPEAENLFAKLEGQEEVVGLKSEHNDDIIEIPKELITEQGFVGQLVVRQSGKVELNWGGVSMVLKKGIETSFLSTVVTVDDRPGRDEGIAMGMGQVMGKFVVTPDLENML